MTDPAARRGLYSSLSGTSRGTVLMLAATMGFVVMQSLIRVAGRRAARRW